MSTATRLASVYPVMLTSDDIAAGGGVQWVRYTGPPQSFGANAMTRDGDWTMISNKATSARPAPQASGSEEDLLPAWTPTQQSARATYTVYNEWTVNTGGWINQYGGTVLTQNLNALHTITLMVNGVVNDTFTSTPVNPTLYWHDITPIVISSGSVIRVTVKVTQVSNNLMYWQSQTGLFATPPTYCSLAVGSKDGAAAGSTAYDCHLMFIPGTASSNWDVVAFGGSAAVGGGGGGIADAPSDGNWYGRQNAAWSQVVPLASNSTMTGFLTLAGDPSAALGAATKQYVDAHGLSDAPSDGNWYGRENGAWVQVVPVVPVNGNTAIGSAAGNPGAITGGNNISIGASAGQLLTTGQYNVNVGRFAGNALTTQSFNTNVGANAGGYFASGPNTNIGYTAGLGVSGSTTGVNNTNVGYSAGTALTTGASNTLLGHAAGSKVTSGNYNNTVGYNAGFNITTGANNIVVGGSAGAGIVAGNSNIVIGYGVNVPTGDPTGYINIGSKFQYDQYNNILLGGNPATALTGTLNVNIGYSAGASGTTGGANVNIGEYAGTSQTTVSNGVCIGYLAGRYSTGASNLFIGSTAGQGVSGSTTGTSNTFVGGSAGTVFTTGSGNSCFGAGAGTHITTATNCTYLGGNAGTNATLNNSNTCVGYNAGISITTGANNTIIGARLSASQLVTGNGNIIVGYNVDTPSDTTSYLNIGGAITGQMNTGPLVFAVAIQLPVVAVASLPAAGTAGRKMFVNNANSTSFGTAVAGGGTNTVPVYDNGTSWMIG